MSLSSQESALRNRFPFSSAAERAFSAAQHDERISDAPGVRLLAALAGEVETLAGEMLHAAGVDEGAVERWRRSAGESEADSDRRSPPIGFDAFLHAAWGEAQSSEFQREIGTEHLLLAVLACDPVAATWLADQGVKEFDVRAAVGLTSAGAESPEPLPWPEESEAAENFEDSDASTPGGDLAHADQGGSRAPVPQHVAAEAAWRILDASANRCTEGLRVVEDYVRFILDSEPLTEAWKSIRHELAQTLATLDPVRRAAARAAEADVGRGLEVDAMVARNDLADVLRANCERAKQSLRSLEEFSKVVAPPASRRIEALRYRVYEAEQATLLAGLGPAPSGRPTIESARLYVLLDGRSSEEEFCEIAAAVYRGGAEVVQLRDKRLSDRDLLARGEKLREIAEAACGLFVFNDRPDLAAATGADGVHVGQDEASVSACRCVLGADALVGVSTHDCDQLRRAIADGASYVGLGPTFPSSTKEFASFAGLEFLQQAAAIPSPPAFAIGGIRSDNLDAVLQTGVRRVAVGTAIVDADDPEEAARRFASALRTS